MTGIGVKVVLSAVFFCLVCIQICLSGPRPGHYIEDVRRDVLLDSPPETQQYLEGYPSFIYLLKVKCIRRGGNCDDKPNDCCYNSTCRCNLWGSNCRCQRMGLFQK